MGYSVSKEATGLANHLHPGKAWSIVSRQDNKNIVRSTDGMMADEYLINLDAASSVRDELEIYLYRKTQELPLVKIIAASIRQTPSSGYLCEGSAIHVSALVLTERISHTLADAPQISFPEALYVMSQALIGFSQLYHRVGPFEVTDRMIGITSQGFVKVWMSQNFAMNHPHLQRLSPLQTTSYLPGDNIVRRTQISMVRNILRVIEYHTENGQFPNEWELEELSILQFNFANVHQLVRRYVAMNKIFVPDRLSDGKVLRITKKQIESRINKEVDGLPSQVQVASVAPVAPTLVQTHIQPNRILGVSRQISRPPVNVSRRMIQAPIPQIPITQPVSISRAIPMINTNSVVNNNMASGLANLIKSPIQGGSVMVQQGSPLPARSPLNPPGLPMTFPIQPLQLQDPQIPNPPHINTDKLDDLIQPTDFMDIKPTSAPRLDFLQDDFKIPQNNSLLQNNSGLDMLPPAIPLSNVPVLDAYTPQIIPTYENFKQDMYAGLAADYASYAQNQNISNVVAANINNYLSNISSESSKIRPSAIPTLY